MADVNDAEAIREARRRKILENSERRLKLITGVIDKASYEVNSVNNKKKERKDELKEEHKRGNHFPNFAEKPHRVDDLKDEEVLTDERVTIKNVEKNVGLYNVMFLACIAVITRTSFHFLHEYINKLIFLPFMLFEMQVLVFQKRSNVNSVLSTVLHFSKLSSEQVTILISSFTLLENFIKDLCIYFFIFTVVHLCIEICNYI